jgi:hypothetical protein
MAEVIGVVSGLLTIAKAVRINLEVASALYKAPEEILALQVCFPTLPYSSDSKNLDCSYQSSCKYELERFTIVVQDISCLQRYPELSENIVDTELSRSSKTIAALQTFINDELLKGGLASCRAWASKKRRIKEMRDNLENGRSQLMLVLIASNS